MGPWTHISRFRVPTCFLGAKLALKHFYDLYSAKQPGYSLFCGGIRVLYKFTIDERHTFKNGTHFPKEKEENNFHSCIRFISATPSSFMLGIGSN